MLTGQCKNDFEYWLKNEDILGDFDWTMPHNPYADRFVIDDFYMMPDTVKYAYITEFFDSVGKFKIIVIPQGYDSYVNDLCLSDDWYFALSDEDGTDVSEGNLYKTRREATKAAIEKANELYNDKFN